MAFLFMLVMAFPIHAFAEEALFLGTKYARANGYVAQSKTTFVEMSRNSEQAEGHVTHRQEMGSFDLVYIVNCTETEFYFHFDVGSGKMPARFVSLKSFIEWSELRFPDGVVGFLGGSGKTPDAQQLASQRHKRFLSQGEPQAPEKLLIDGGTNLVISRYPDRLKFIAEALLAKTCHQ